LKISLLMMLILIADVVNDRPFHGFTYTEGSISILPAKESSIGECLANPARGIAFCGIDQIGNGGCRRHRNVQVNVVRLALRLYDPRIFGLGNRSHIGMKTIAPLPIYKGSPLLRTPDEMKIDTEEFARHARHNRSGNKVVKKFFQKSAAPSALVYKLELFSRPYGRAYALPALRASCFGLPTGWTIHLRDKQAKMDKTPGAILGTWCLHV
jgi:hypothetical protein